MNFSFVLLGCITYLNIFHHIAKTWTNGFIVLQPLKILWHLWSEEYGLIYVSWWSSNTRSSTIASNCIYILEDAARISGVAESDTKEIVEKWLENGLNQPAASVQKNNKATCKEAVSIIAVGWKLQLGIS